AAGFSTRCVSPTGGRWMRRARSNIAVSSTPKPSKKLSDLALVNLKQAFPVFEKAEIAQRWAGYIDVTPDAVPVISAIDKIPGFHIATGFSGHGFGIGPAAGKLMADIVLGRQPLVDPKDFRFSRFSDG